MSFRIFKRFPLLVPSIQAGSLMAGGDVIAQVFIERKIRNDYNWLRTARFFGLGFIVLGPVLRLWYGVLDKKFGSKSMKGIFKKVAFDQVVFAPSCLVAIISLLGVMERKPIQEIQIQLRKDYLDILITNWTIWPAVQLLNFSLVPLQHQVLIVQFVALLWNTYLSWKVNS